MKWIVALLFSVPAWAQFVVPATPFPVNDYADILTADEKEMIARKLVETKKAVGVQIGVLLVKSLNGDSIEQASMKVAESWELGSKDDDTGVLLMLSIEDRKSRLEIGRGLEGIITDADSKRILTSMRSDLKRGAYGAAILSAVEKVSTTVVTRRDEIMRKPVTSESGTPIWFWLLFGGVGLARLIVYLVARNEQKEKEERERKQQHSARDQRISQELFQRFSRPVHPASKKQAAPVGTRSSRSSSRSSRRSSGDVYAPVIASYSSSNDDDSRRSSSSDYSSSSSSWSGGGGDFSGGGSSDSW